MKVLLIIAAVFAVAMTMFQNGAGISFSEFNREARREMIGAKVLTKVSALRGLWHTQRARFSVWRSRQHWAELEAQWDAHPAILGAPRAEGATAAPPKDFAELGRAWAEFKVANEADKEAQTVESKRLLDDWNDRLGEVTSALNSFKETQDALAKIVNRPGSTPRQVETDLEVREFLGLFKTNENVAIEDIHISDDARDMLAGYTPAFNHYLKTGQVRDEMQVVEDPKGGYWVDPVHSGRITEFLTETSDLRAVAAVETIGTMSLTGDYDIEDAATGGMVHELATRSETATPPIGMWEIFVHEQYAEPHTTQIALDDARRDIASWLAGKIATIFARTENTKFFTGTGTGEARGLLTYSAGTPANTSMALFTVIRQVVSGHASLIMADGLVDLVYALKSVYRRNAVFGMNNLTLSEVRKLQDGHGAYIWQPDFTKERNDLILGHSVHEWADMPDIAGGAESIVFGDFNEAYQIVDRSGIRVLRDDLTTKGKVKFYSTKRFGGDIVNFDALVLQTIST